MIASSEKNKPIEIIIIITFVKQSDFLYPHRDECRV